VLSAAITAGLARGLSLKEACKAGKDYTLRFLQSSDALLGHHKY
jgi:hydroxymethylpyrimidine/phosphomethylpyrimidine kinase